MNICLLMGYIANDIVLKEINNTVVANFKLHLVRKYKKKGGEQQKEHVWIDCEVWDSAAKTINSYFKKGSKIIVQASIKQHTWEVEENGETKKRSRLIYRVDQFWFPESPKNDDVEPEEQQVQIQALPRTRNTNTKNNNSNKTEDNSDIPF